MPLFEGVDRVLQRLLCILAAARFKRGFAKPREGIGAVGVCWWGERQRPLQIGHCSGRVEAEGAFACQGEESPRGVFQNVYLVGVSGGVGEIKRGCVAIGQRVGDFFDSLGSA